MEPEPFLVSDRAFDWPDHPLAEGGMARIFEARDRRLPRTVILKTPRIERTGGDALSDEERTAFVERLQAEAEVLAKLQHPSIVTIHEVGRDGAGKPFCVLERVQGRPLADVLDELAAAEEDGRPRTVERIQLVSNLVAIAEALACAHDLGIVHRDVNPNNILVGPRGETTLIDWGLASDTRSARNVTRAIDLAVDEVTDGRYVTIGAGTPPYMSLEQTQGVAARPAFDVYSFGATLYHVVSGHPPFEYGSVAEFLELVSQRTPPPPASLDDRDLSAIIALAMAPDPETRPSASELIDHLRAYLTGELVFAQRYSRTGRLSRWIREQPVAAASIVLVVVAAVALALGWTIMEQRTARAAREAAEVKAAAEREVAAQARAQAEAERQRADAVVERQRAEDVARTKEAEARRALDEANAARGDTARYKQLKEKSDAAAGAAEQARQAADRGQERAEEAAQAAAAQAARSSAEAERSRASADAAAARADVLARERDDAIAQRNAAEQVRAAAEHARATAEQARSAAETARDSAERSLADAQQRIADLERALDEARRPPPEPEDTPVTTP
jgi:eukaryotic-like serine/threonine-protein kinase